MRKLVLQIGVTLDGLVVWDGAEDWGLRPEDPGLTAWKVESLRGAGAHLMGRVTYEEMAAHWPGSNHAYAAPMNEIPKVVFSRSLTSADWPESEIARGPIADEIARLKAQPGRDLIAHGGAEIAQALTAGDLIDEYRLICHPVALGHGKPLFGDLPEPLQLDLTETISFATGSVVCVYVRRGEA